MGLGAWDSPEREKRRDFARDGRAETGETMPSPRAPSRRLSSPLSFVRALGFRGFFFCLVFYLLFVASKGKRWLLFVEITFLQRPFGKCAFCFLARAGGKELGMGSVAGWLLGAGSNRWDGLAVSEFWKESEGLFVIFRSTTGDRTSTGLL
jgi:hypothetical protein